MSFNIGCWSLISPCNAELASALHLQGLYHLCNRERSVATTESSGGLASAEFASFLAMTGRGGKDQLLQILCFSFDQRQLVAFNLGPLAVFDLDQFKFGRIRHHVFDAFAAPGVDEMYHAIFGLDH